MKWILPKLHFEVERWKWNKEHEIWVSNFGNFKDANKQDIKCGVQNNYLMLKSRKTKNKIFAHRLVMMTWCPIDNADGMTVDHLDHNKRNNKVTNLEWVTKAENIRRAVEDQRAAGVMKSQKIKFTPTLYTLEHFYLCCNGLYFTNIEEVFSYAKTQKSTLTLNHKLAMDKIYQTLVNAYNHKNPEYVANGFVKEKYNLELSIVKRSA